MNKAMIAFFGIIILVAIGFFIFAGNDDSASGNVVSAQMDGDVQKITLGMKSFNYYPQIIKVAQGVPLEITLDQSVVGCYRAFTVKEFGVSYNSRTPSDKVVFTPTKKGTFTFSCSMGMGSGTIIVE